MKIYFCGPRRKYIITNEDRLWLMRMCIGECGEKADAVRWPIWAMLNRFLLHPKQEQWPTLTSLLRAFSQPINPKWIGEYCAVGGKGYGTKACDIKLIERRKKIQSLTEEEIPDLIWEQVTQICTGESFISIQYARITNWHAADAETLSKYPNGVLVDGNWFFAEDKIMLPGLVEILIKPYEVD